MHLTELKAFLASLGTHPKKGLSQNFLIDQNIVEKIVRQAAIEKGDRVLEIGPGPGVLTKALLDHGAEVIAVELDQVFAEALKRFDVTVYQGDILDFPLEKFGKKGKVVSNLPYHLTAPILAKLVPRRDLFSTLTVMIQEEVARRIAAEPGGKSFGSLTLFLQFYTTICYGFKVSRRCFYPAPKVDSAVVTFTLHSPPPVDPDHFFEMTRTAFGQRRKMLKNTLSALYEPERVIKAFEDLGLDPKVRPEQLSLDTFLALYSSLLE